MSAAVFRYHRLLLLLFGLILPAYGYFFPGIHSPLYKDDEVINVKTLKMISVHTQIPFDYYYLPFCAPKELQVGYESLGELLSGDVVHNTPYFVKKDEGKTCKRLCSKNFTTIEKEDFRLFILNHYKAHLMLDNLPSIQPKKNGKNSASTLYEKGFHIGKVKKDRKKAEDITIFNHLQIKVRYHPAKSNHYSVVGFEVTARERTQEDGCDSNLDIEQTKFGSYVFSYSVEFISSVLEFKSRWDPYMNIKNSTIHWTAFAISLLPALILSFSIAIIFGRVLKKDFLRYNRIFNDPECQEEDSGWKLVHGDVFRPPPHTTMFSLIIGVGFQILSIIAELTVLLILGIVSLTKRGSFPNAILGLFVINAFFSGYISTITYRYFRRKSDRLIAFYSATLFPTLNFAVFIFLEFILWTKGSSGAVSFSTLLYVFVFVVLFSMPISYLGSFLARRATMIPLPVKVNIIPRQIIDKRVKLAEMVKRIFYSAIPFFAASLEIYYLMNSLWLDQFFFMVTGFALVSIILIILTCQVAMINCYTQLNNGNYHWWWKSFQTGGASGVYLFLYGLFYGAFRLHISNGTTALLYCVYMSLLSFGLFLVMGTLSTTASFYFVNTIYSTIKID